MSDHKTENRRALLDRHARVAVLIDRLQSSWVLCTYDDLNDDYRPVDDAWGNELVAELRWLNELYGEAIANDGDVRGCLLPRGHQEPSPAPAPKGPVLVK